MVSTRRLAILCGVLAAVAFGQWSAPVTLATGLQPYGAGPTLVPHVGDSIWVFWMGQVTPVALYGRCFTGDSWRPVETLAQSTAGLYWPAGVVDDSGRVLVAYYDGSYPVKYASEQDSWGIYTATLIDTGWSPPYLAIGTLMQGFPTSVRLGKARDGSVGLLWDASDGSINAMESVMVSRRIPGGWSPRCCIAAGSYPEVYCHCGSLVPGDSSDFLTTFSRWTAPGPSVVDVCCLNDSLTGMSVVFTGTQPMLARGLTSRFLVFTQGDTLLGAEDYGAGWSEPAVIAAGLGFGEPSLCADPLGWGWVCWPDGFQQSVLASHNWGTGWSQPETVVTSGALGSPRIASDALGNLHCVWFDHTGGGSGELQHARRIGRPGLEENAGLQAASSKLGPTIVRRALVLGAGSRQQAVDRPELLDAAGRKVVDLHLGANDVSRLPSGVYFMREARMQGQAQAVRRIVRVP